MRRHLLYILIFLLVCTISITAYDIDGLSKIFGHLWVGDDTDTDKYIYFQNSDENYPALKFNSSANKIQFAHDGVAFSDIGSNSASLQFIEVNIGTSASYSSTTSIPDGALVTMIWCDISVSYSASATIEVFIDGTSDLEIMHESENYPQTQDLYIKKDIYSISSSTTGIVRVDIGVSPVAGAGKILVGYIKNPSN